MCDRWGIPHSHFLGGPPVWTDLDREKAHAYKQHMREQCDGCGTREEEWQPEAGGHRFAYVPETWRCPGCELLAMEQDNIPEDDGKGVKIALVRNAEVSDG
jgi:rubredoxin